MNRRSIFAGILSLALAASVVPNALAEIFQKTITLGPGAGVFTMEDLGIGDTVTLTLVNPTNQPLVFETTENIGNNKSWTVAPNSQVVVDYTYTKPFDDDVEFVVKQAGSPDAPAVAQGTLIRAHQGEQPVSYQQPAGATTQQPAVSPSGGQIESAPMNNVRGYW